MSADDGHGGTTLQPISVSVTNVSEPGQSIEGNSGNDVLNGTPGNDRIDGTALADSCRTMTSQVAPTILEALQISPERLRAVRKEGTRPLPLLPIGDDD